MIGGDWGMREGIREVKRDSREDRGPVELEGRSEEVQRWFGHAKFYLEVQECN